MIFGFICNSLTGIFYIILTSRICAALNKAALFLRQSVSENKYAVKYDRIIKFSKLLCAVFFIFNVILQLIESGIKTQNQLMAHSSWTGVNFQVKQSYIGRTELVLSVLAWFKPGCYAAIYIWLRRA